MTRSVRTGSGDTRIILPGTWVRVPLGSRAEAEAFVKRLVRRQMGPADRLARVRRDAAAEVMANVAEAVSVGVHTYLMALELLPGVPFPAALLMLDEDWPGESSQLARDDTAGALRMAYPDAEVEVQRNGPVARRAEMVQGTTGDGEPVLTMRLEYHVPYPDRGTLLMARVNVPNIPSAEPFATLFDEILDSVTFGDADPRPDEGAA